MRKAPTGPIDFTKNFIVFITLTTKLDHTLSSNQQLKLEEKVQKCLDQLKDIKYYIRTEFTNKYLEYTKIHYHGLLYIENEKAYRFSDFIKNWKNHFSVNQVDIQYINTLEEETKSKKYIDKFKQLYKNYTHVTLKRVYQNIVKKNYFKTFERTIINES